MLDLVSFTAIITMTSYLGLSVDQQRCGGDHQAGIYLKPFPRGEFAPPGEVFFTESSKSIDTILVVANKFS